MVLSLRMLLTTASLLFIAAESSAKIGHPAIYSTHSLSLLQVCAEEEKITLVTNENETLASLCPREYRKCVLNRACIRTNKDGSRSTFSYFRFNPRLQRETFRLVTDACLYGQGTGVTSQKKTLKTCLDPYFSVAADATEHFAGEVIFVPKLIGLVLPTGEVHDGYLIVRDSNEDTRDRGPDYYSFFTGLESAEDSTNPFLRMMLDNIDSLFTYQIVDGPMAEQVRQSRNYPNLPQQLREFYR